MEPGMVTQEAKLPRSLRAPGYPGLNNKFQASQSYINTKPNQQC